MISVRLCSNLILLPLIVWLSSACAPVYLPSTPNTPMLKSQGSGQAVARLGASGVEVQGAYAVTDNTYLIGGLTASNNPGDDNAISSRHGYFEFGAGKSWRPAGRMVLEGAGGLGIGSGRGNVDYQFEGSTVRHASGNYFKPFLQGNIAFQTRAADFGFVNRLSLVQFGEITRTEGSTVVIDDSPGYIFWEPSLFLQLGPERLKFNTHIGITSPVSANPNFDYQFLNIGFGVQYRWNH